MYTRSLEIHRESAVFIACVHYHLLLPPPPPCVNAVSLLLNTQNGLCTNPSPPVPLPNEARAPCPAFKFVNAESTLARRLRVDFFANAATVPSDPAWG